MSYRCTNAFTFNDHVYAGGCEVQDDDQILETHNAHFVKVGESTLPSETASAAHPRAVKKAAPKKAPAKPTEPVKEGE